MAHYEINRIQDRIIVVSDADTTEVSLTPLNGTEADYFIEASTDHMWKRVGSDAAGYDYTDLGAIGGGGGGGGNVVDTLADTLGAGNITGGRDIVMSSGDLITDDGTGAGVQILSTGGAGINLQTPVSASINNSTNQFQVIDLSSNQLLLARTASGNPQVTLGASAVGNGTRLYLNDVNKSLTIRTDTDDAEVGINGAAVAGKAFNVVGNTLLDGTLTCSNVIELGGNSSRINLNNAGVSKIGDVYNDDSGVKITITNSTATIELDASAGVSTSAGLTVGGGFVATAIATKTGDYGLTASDHTILIDANSQAVEVSAVSALNGQIFFIKCIDISNAATVANVDGGTYTFAGLDDSIIVQFDNSVGELRLMAEYK